MSKQLFIPTGLEVAGTAISAMTAGRAGFYDGDADNLVDDLDLVSRKAPLQIVWKKSDGSIESSNIFTIEDIVSVSKAGYDAGTAQVVTITPALPATQAKGDIYTLKVIITTPGTAVMQKKTYEVINTTGVDFTATTLGNAFRSLINADSEIPVTATGTTTLILTADIDENFRVATDDNMAAAGVVYTTNMDLSFGTPAKIKDLEAECESYGQGITNKVGFPVKRPDSEVGSGNYDVYIVALELKGKNVDSANPSKYEDLTLYIAEPTGAGVVGAELEKLFLGIIDIADDGV